MRLKGLAWAALAGFAFAAAPLAGQEPPAVTLPAERTPLEVAAAEVVRLLNGEAQPEQVFTSGFRAAVADAQVRSLSASLTAQLGPALAVARLTPREGSRAELAIRFERGMASGAIAIDGAQANRVSELYFTKVEPLAPSDDSAAKIAAELAALPGSVSAWFGPLGGAPVIAQNADTPLALGSAFKLYVLAALAEDVKAGRRKWSDVVALDQKSYPSGQLHTWPQGAPVTLHTLASLMISVSDNTATDQLIAVLGKPRILKLMKDSGHADPAANDPFLTTRELFVLKASDRERIAGWRKSDRERRADILAALAAETPSLADVNAGFANGPKAIDIEWFASPADLAKLFAHMRRTADPEAFAILAINPSASGEAIAANWRTIGFKGGSEPGVLNFTWLLTDRQGRDWMLTLGWNNDAAVVDEAKLGGLAQRILLLPR